MLEAYARVAARIYPFRVLLYVGMAVSFAFLVHGVLFPGSGAQETRMFLPLVVMMWLVCVALFAHSFARATFPVAAAGDGWLRRTKTALVRLGWHLLALAVFAFGAAALLLTVRAAIMFGS